MRKGYTYVGALASLLAGVAIQHTQSPQRGIERVREAMATFNQSPNALAHTYFNALSAAAEIAVGETQKASAILDGGLEVGARYGEQFWRSELHRLVGELEARTNPGAAHASLLRAIDESRSLGAYRLMLRAALSLHRHALDRPTRQSAQDSLREALVGVRRSADDAEVVSATELISTDLDARD